MIKITCDFCGVVFEPGNVRYTAITTTGPTVWDSCEPDLMKAITTLADNLKQSGPITLTRQITI